MDAGTGFTQQVYELSSQFLPKEWIMEKWEEGFYITAMAGSASGGSLVVMSKGTPYTQQSYKVSDSFPFKWINKKWKEGFFGEWGSRLRCMAACWAGWGPLAALSMAACGPGVDNSCWCCCCWRRVRPASQVSNLGADFRPPFLTSGPRPQ